MAFCKASIFIEKENEKNSDFIYDTTYFGGQYH